MESSPYIECRTKVATLGGILANRAKVTMGRMPEQSTPPLSFEKSLEELERTVKELEKGDLPLERSLALFEAGMRLSAECKKLLEEAETRVEVLTKRGSDMVAAPYNPEKPAK